MVTFRIGDWVTGRRIQTIPDVISGSWAEKLNAADSVSCDVPLNDPAIRRLGLRESATPWKTYLAAMDDDLVLAYGPIKGHSFRDGGNVLTLTAGGVWDWFTEKRLLLPELAGRLPSDPTTNTRYTAVSTDPADPWPTDTRTSLQGMAVRWVAQALSIAGGQMQMILPTEIPGTNERNEAGANLASVGARLTQLTQVDDGPDIKFQGRLMSDRTGIECVMLIGTPTDPLLHGAIEQTFNVGLDGSSVSNFVVSVDGSGLGSRAFASGGRSDDQVLIAMSDDAALPNAGYPLLELVDSSHSTVSKMPTLQGYSDELVLAGRRPTMTFSFDHDTSSHPFLSGFNVGDYARVKVRNNAYLADDSYRCRLVGRGGDAQTKKVSLTFQAVL